MLEKMKPIIKEEELGEAKCKENHNKNRTMEALPAQTFRVLLMTSIKGHNNYINAVWVNVSLRNLL